MWLYKSQKRFVSLVATVRDAIGQNGQQKSHFCPQQAHSKYTIYFRECVGHAEGDSESLILNVFLYYNKSVHVC